MQNQTLNQLIEMECSPILSQAAIKVTKSNDLSVLVDWITQHCEEEQKWTKWLAEYAQKQIGKSISSLVNQDFSKILQNKGHSKHVAEKSLLFTNNVSVENAEGWIEHHKNDSDFQEQLFLQPQQIEQSNLSDEQAKIKLKELVEKARQNRRIKQEQQERQRQKNRLRYGKQMTQAKRIAQEQAVKRRLELEKIQKAKDAQYKKQLLDQMKRQKQIKTGKKIQQVGPQKMGQKKLSKYQQVQIQCQQVKVGMHAYPDKAKVFFETAQIYVDNIIKNKGEEKFRKINKENKAFQARIVQVFGGVETLHVLGYEQSEGLLILKDYNQGQLRQISRLFQRYKSYY